MKKISQWKAKVLLTAIYGCILLLFLYFGLPCIFLQLFGIPCPGCGMSRAVLAALRFDFAAALRYHPMFWSMPILYLYFLFDGRLIGRKNADKAVLYLLGAGFLIQWLWKLIEL